MLPSDPDRCNLVCHVCRPVPSPFMIYECTLLEKVWRISLYVTDDAIAELYVTLSLVK